MLCYSFFAGCLPCRPDGKSSSANRLAGIPALSRFGRLPRLSSSVSGIIGAGVCVVGPSGSSPV